MYAHWLVGSIAASFWFSKHQKLDTNNNTIIIDLVASSYCLEAAETENAICICICRQVHNGRHRQELPKKKGPLNGSNGQSDSMKHEIPRRTK